MHKSPVRVLSSWATSCESLGDDACTFAGTAFREETTVVDGKDVRQSCDGQASAKKNKKPIAITHLVVVRSAIRSGTDASETPSIHQTVEGMVVAVLEKERHDQRLEQIGFEDFPGASVWHPANDVGKLLLAQNGVEFDGKLLHSDGTLDCATAGWWRRGCSLVEFLFGNRSKVSVIEE